MRMRILTWIEATFFGVQPRFLTAALTAPARRGSDSLRVARQQPLQHFSPGLSQDGDNQCAAPAVPHALAQ